MNRLKFSVLSFVIWTALTGPLHAQIAPSPEIQKIQAKAEAGDAEAQNKLGTQLQAQKRYTEAMPWFEKASAQGHALATYHLAYLYDTGSGISQDQKKAFKLYAKSADLGQAEAMWHMAQMYDSGKGVKRDAHKSCVWSFRTNKYVSMDNQFLLAVAGGQLSKLEAKLPKNQLTKCKKEANAWSPTVAAASSNK